MASSTTAPSHLIDNAATILDSLLRPEDKKEFGQVSKDLATMVTSDDFFASTETTPPQEDELVAAPSTSPKTVISLKKEEEEEEEEEEDGGPSCCCEELIIQTVSDQLKLKQSNWEHYDRISRSDIQAAVKTLLLPSNMTEFSVNHDIMKEVNGEDEGGLLENELLKKNPHFRKGLSVISQCLHEEEEIVSPHTVECCHDTRHNDTTNRLNDQNREALNFNKKWNELAHEVETCLKRQRKEKAAEEDGAKDDDINNEEESEDIKSRVAMITNTAFSIQPSLRLLQMQRLYTDARRLNSSLTCLQLCKHDRNCKALEITLMNLTRCMRLNSAECRVSLPHGIGLPSSQKHKDELDRIVLGVGEDAKLTYIRLDLQVNPYDPMLCYSSAKNQPFYTRKSMESVFDEDIPSGIGFVADTLVVESEVETRGQRYQVLTASSRILTFKPKHRFQNHNSSNYPYNRLNVQTSNNLTTSFSHTMSMDPISALYMDNPEVNRPMYSTSSPCVLTHSTLDNNTVPHNSLLADENLQSDLRSLPNQTIRSMIDDMVVLRHRHKVSELEMCLDEPKVDASKTHVKVICPTTSETLDGVNQQYRINILKKIMTSTTSPLDDVKMRVLLNLKSLLGKINRRYSLTVISKVVGDIVHKLNSLTSSSKNGENITLGEKMEVTMRTFFIVTHFLNSCLNIGQLLGKLALTIRLPQLISDTLMDMSTQLNNTSDLLSIHARQEFQNYRLEVKRVMESFVNIEEKDVVEEEEEAKPV